MQRQLGNEDHTAAALAQVRDLIKKKANARALQATKHFLCEDRQAMQWNPQQGEILSLHFELAVEQRSDELIRSGLQSYMRRVDAQAHPRLDSLERLVKALTNLMTASTHDPQHARHLELLSGMRGESQLATESEWWASSDLGFFRRCIRVVMGLLGSRAKYEIYYQQITRAAFSILKTMYQTKLPQEVCITFDNVFRFYSRRNEYALKKDEKDLPLKLLREALPDIMRTRVEQLRVATALHRWSHVTLCAREVWLLIANVRRRGAEFSREDLLSYYAALAETLFTAGSDNFHAFSLLQCVLLSQNLSTFASPAVLAVLCVLPHAQRVETAGLAKVFNVIRPTRNRLIADLQRPRSSDGSSILDKATPEVQQLYQMLVGKQSGLLLHSDTLATSLRTIATCSEWQQYVPRLSLLLTLHVLNSISQSYSRISLDALSIFCPYVTPKELVSQLEIISIELKNEGAVRLCLDSVNGSVQLVRKEQLMDNLPSVIHSVAKQSQIVSEKNITVTQTSQKLHKIVSEWLAQRDADAERSLERSFLCDKRQSKAGERTERESENKKKLEAEREGELRAKEELRVRKAQMAEAIVLSKRVETLEARERRIWAIRQLNLRYNGLRLLETIADVSLDKCVEEMIRLLTTFKKDSELASATDAEMVEFFERSCREVETPLRKIYFEQIKRTERTTLEERRSNRLKQLAVEQQSAEMTRKRLLRFSSMQRIYEKRMAKAAEKEESVDNVDKRRTEQERLLEQTRKQRDAMAIAAAERVKESSE